MASSLIEEDSYISISQFFQDKSIFITGGTGFVGKVLVEKLLRSCPGIKNVYLLMRPKREQSVKTRLAGLFNVPLFDRLRKERPLQLNKIVPISGDITEPKLGISEADEMLLIQTVSVVFHAAATIKFDETLKVSVTINMVGTKRLVELCHRMLNLEALVHVSTAYCNSDREKVDEVIYSPLYDPENIIQCVNWMDDALIKIITPRLVGNLPNTYTFTKALAENIILNESGNLPVAIVRPSIVLSSLQEPVSGWLDNYNGPTGILAAAGKGYFRTMICHEDKIGDIVPVDIVINLIICAAWRTAIAKPNGIPIYNCCTGQQNPLAWKQFILYSFNALRKNPLGDIGWYPAGKFQTNHIMNSVYSFVLHFVPAYLIDSVCGLLGKEQIMVRIHSKLEKAAKCLEYFTTRQWCFIDDNVKSLNKCLSSKDKGEFNFDVTKIDWPKYIENYVLGIRRFIFKEHPSSLPLARKQLNKMLWVHRIFQSALYWAEQGLRVIYISPKELKELPALLHGVPTPDTEPLKLLQIIYLENKQSLLTYLYNLTIKEKLPRGIFVENLDVFLDFDKSSESEKQGSLICASLLNAINICASKFSLPVYLAAGLSVSYKNMVMNPYNFFNIVWTCDSDCSRLTKLVKHPGEPKIEIKLIFKSDTFYLEEIKSIFVT